MSAIRKPVKRAPDDRQLQPRHTETSCAGTIPSDGHQHFDGMQSFFPSPPYLMGSYAVLFLNKHFRKINSVKNQQDRNG